MKRRSTSASHYLRAWRKHAGLTLEQAAERIENLAEQRGGVGPEGRTMTMTHQNLGKIERGKVPYNEHLLELLAEIYQTDLASLLMRDPAASGEVWSVWERAQKLDGPKRAKVIAYMDGLSATGSDGK